jgi:hypothetical protein
MNSLILGEAPKVGRVQRRPVHTFNVMAYPYQIQPFFCAPVLAGETMANLLLQSRVVTDPINNPLIGWHQEYYFFYIKLTDLDFDANEGVDDPQGGVGQRVKMLLADPAFDPSDPVNKIEAIFLEYYAHTNVANVQQNYIRRCNDLIVKHYFREETDDLTTANDWVGNLPAAKITNGGLQDSLKLKSALVTQDVDLLGDATDDVLMISEVDQALQRYNYMRANGLTDASYEDYLESFGISQPTAKPHEPELIRYVRDWSYPSNTVDPVTGTPSSAVSWSIQERADKRRFFKEPGFLFGVTVTRPKVYLGNQPGAGVGFLDRAEDWLPAQLWNDAQSSIKEYAVGKGPFASVASPYVIDMRDLFLHGDQFLNYDPVLTTFKYNKVALPVAAGLKKYPELAEIQAMFKSSAASMVRQDGIVSLSIQSAQRDMTATT